MSELSVAAVETVLKTYEDPYLETDLVTAKCIKDIAVDGGVVSTYTATGSTEAPVLPVASEPVAVSRYSPSAGTVSTASANVGYGLCGRIAIRDHGDGQGRFLTLQVHDAIGMPPACGLLVEQPPGSLWFA